MKKAYDSSPQHLVIKSMAQYGLDKPSCLVLKSILENHTARCGSDGAGFKIPITSGVLQGSIISPCEFNFFINKIASDASELCVNISPQPNSLTISNIAYADDLSLISYTHSSHQLHNTHVGEWAASNQMEFNPTKSATIIIQSSSSNEPTDPFILQHTSIPIVNPTKLIGIELTAEGALERKSSPHHAINAAKSWKRTKHKTPSNTLIPIFYSFVLAPAIYGSEIAAIYPKLMIRTNRFLKESLSIPMHSNNAIGYEFTGTYRPNTIIMKRRLRFAIKSIQSTVPTIRTAIDHATRNLSPWWGRVVQDATTLNIQQGLQSLISARNNEINNVSFSAQLQTLCGTLLTAIKTTIDEHESAWFHQQLHYLHHKCPPGKGSFIFRNATVPGGQSLVKLRYDINEHMQRHQPLQRLNNRCPFCTNGPLESNEHLLFECRANRLDPTKLQKLKDIREQLTALYDGNMPRSEYLSWLTGPEPSLPNGSQPSMRTINLIATASQDLEKLRAHMFITYRSRISNSSIPNPARRRLTPDDRIQICIALQGTKDPDTFQQVAQRDRTTLKEEHWKTAWLTATSNTGLNPIISANKYLTFLKTLHLIGPALCTASPHRRWQHTKIKFDITRDDPTVKHDATNRFYTLRNTAQHIPWARELIIWRWLESTPLAFAWILKPQNALYTNHCRLVGTNAHSEISKTQMTDLRADIGNALRPQRNEAPAIPTKHRGQYFQSLKKNKQSQIIQTITTKPSWQVNNTSPIFNTGTHHLQTQNIIDNTQHQMGTPLEEAFALATQWFLSLLNPNPATTTDP